MSQFDYSIQGVALTDTRWAADPRTVHDGVWFMRTGTSVLPKLPGFRATRFSRPGQHGESQVQHAPVEPVTREFLMRFLAIDHDPNSPTYQQEGKTWDERMQFLEQNVNEFLFRTRIGFSGSGGNLRLERTFPTYEHFPNQAVERTGGMQYTAGRFLASSEAEMDRDARWADYTFVFEIPSGTWFTEWQTVTASIPEANRTYSVEVPMGTAAVPDMRVAVSASDGALPMGSLFTNDLGVGFQMGHDTEGWQVMDMDTRKAGSSGSEVDWNVERNDASLIHEHGRPLGSGLLVMPGVPGTGRQVGRVNVRLTAPGVVHFSVRPRWF